MISVILVTYNSMNVLPNCMDSLAASEIDEDLEIILVDNASTDNTWEMISKYAAEPQRFRVIAKQLPVNNGYAYANNIGFAESTGDVVLLLNPDTVVGRTAIAESVRLLRQDPNHGAVGCRLHLPDGTLDKACRRSFPTLWNSATRFSRLSFLFPRSPWFAGYNLTYLDERGTYEVDCLCGAYMMIPRHVYDEVGGLDEDFFMYGEDIYLCYLIKQHGYKIWYTGAVDTLHIKGGNGGRKSAASRRQFYLAMWVYWRKVASSSR